MVPGTPTTGTLCSSMRRMAPRKVPSPPMATRPSIPAAFSLATALARPSSVRNSWLRAVRRMVPPRCRMLATSRTPRGTISPWIMPA
jgi:hypothetical protein